jgi:hypothetical protein
MYRRRRRSQEIGFSFDSFLDVVANVVGIIIRLILVVWVGARAYGTLHPAPRPAGAAPTAATAPAPVPHDPLQEELARHRQELDRLQARLLEQLRHLEQVQASETATAGALAGLSARRQQVEKERAGLDHALAGHTAAASLSLAELQERSRKLTEEIRALEKLPPVTKTLHYQTPVSRPVHSDELHFECRQGRVAFIDLAALLDEVQRRLDEHSKELRSQWQVRAVAGPVGAFQLRYTVERQHGLVEAALPGGTPDPDAGFRCDVSRWEVEPVAEPRGEALDTALAPGSEFRQIADVLDPQQTTVTFWVYPDSFPVYRRLRDYLYERNVVVAGRPLPDGLPIAFSHHGTQSRGQ